MGLLIENVIDSPYNKERESIGLRKKTHLKLGKLFVYPVAPTLFALKCSL